ncbi:MAG: hypothetical protein NC489_43910, partial [Ruminococcus flavefaciens]|nr:hypothetical protein [Ruminococcus flavefaciens]
QLKNISGNTETDISIMNFPQILLEIDSLCESVFSVLFEWILSEIKTKNEKEENRIIRMLVKAYHPISHFDDKD